MSRLTGFIVHIMQLGIIAAILITMGFDYSTWQYWSILISTMLANVAGFIEGIKQ